MAAAANAAPVPASSVGDDPAQGSDQPPPDAVVQEAPEVEAGLDRIYEEACSDIWKVVQTTAHARSATLQQAGFERGEGA